MNTKTLIPIIAYPVLFLYCKKYVFFGNARRKKEMQKELNSNIIYKN